MDNLCNQLQLLETISKISLPIIAASGLFIAYWQYQAKKELVSIELFQSRFDIYKTIMSAIKSFDQFISEEHANKALLNLRSSLDEAYFLLPNDIYEKIKVIETKLNGIRDLNNSLIRLEDSLNNYPGNKLATTKEEIENAHQLARSQLKDEFLWISEKAPVIIRDAFKVVLGRYKF